MCSKAPGWLHSKRLNVWRVARRRRETPWRLSTFHTVARWRPTSAARRIGPQFVRARASRMRCSSAALSAHGHDRGTGRRGAHHAPLTRSPSLASSHRSRAVVTVVGEQPIDRATARAFSPARRRATISRFARGPNRHLPSVMSGPPSEPSVVATESLRRGPDVLLSRSAGPWAAQLAAFASAYVLAVGAWLWSLRDGTADPT